MRLWRITHRDYALDRQCADASLFGGRWNPVGMPVLYSGGSVALTALEKLVHLGLAPCPPLVLVAVDMPDTASVYEPDLAALPVGWDALPISASAQTFGESWLRRNDTLAMKIPSAIVPEAANFVINPAHADYPEIQITVLRPFAFDRRLL